MRDEDEMDPDLRSTSGGGAGPGIRYVHHPPTAILMTLVSLRYNTVRHNVTEEFCGTQTRDAQQERKIVIVSLSTCLGFCT